MRCSHALPQPVTATDSTGTTWTATTWHAETPTTTTPTGADLGRLLRTVHELPPPAAPLPPWQPLADIRRRLTDAEALTDDDRGVLQRLIDDLDRDLPHLHFALPPGPIHGDAHLGNLIPTRGGPVLCDFDSAATGPREVDLVATYGFDVTTWSGWPTLRRLRELKLVTSALPLLASQPAITARWRTRMQSLRNSDDHPWQPYT